MVQYLSKQAISGFSLLAKMHLAAVRGDVEQAFYQMQLHFYKSMQYGFMLLFGILLGVGVLL